MTSRVNLPGVSFGRFIWSVSRQEKASFSHKSQRKGGSEHIILSVYLRCRVDKNLRYGILISAIEKCGKIQMQKTQIIAG